MEGRETLLGIGTTPKMNPARRGAARSHGRRRAGIAIAPNLWRTFFRGRWLLATVVVLLAIGVMVRLGFWQLHRLEGRREANAVIARQLAEPPIAVDARNAATVDPNEFSFRRVRLQGEWDYAHEMELRYRSFDGQPGIHLLTPLRLTGSDTYVLVDRGWIPFEQTGPIGRRPYDGGAGGAIEGLVYATIPQDGPSTDPGVFSQIDLARIGAQLPYPIQHYWVQRLPSGPNQTPPLSEGLPALGDGSHLGYVVQWWAFALTLLITYVFFVNAALLRGRRK
jgi:surfeit locus 1 family protein